MKCCRIASEGWKTFEGFAMVLKNPRNENSRSPSWHCRWRARVSRVFARAYTYAKGRAVRDCYGRQRHFEQQFEFWIMRAKPSLPSRFLVKRLKNKNKNPLTFFSKPSPNPLNPLHRNGVLP